MKKILTFLILLTGYFSIGQQLSYKPINPAFGGDTFNYQWLLNSANAQNSFTDPKLGIDDDKTSLKAFSEKGKSKLASGINKYFSKLVELHPKANYSGMKNKAELMLKKSESNEIKSSIRNR